jgi:hypothetical protein
MPVMPSSGFPRLEGNFLSRDDTNTEFVFGTDDNFHVLESMVISQPLRCGNWFGSQWTDNGTKHRAV